MRIAIDGIFMATPQPGGYKTYTSNLVENLRSIDPTNEYFLLVDRAIPWRATPNWTLGVLGRRGRIGFILREQAALPRRAKRCGVDLLHCPGATGPIVASLPLVLTLYDTIEFSDPLPSPRDVARWTMRVYSRFVQRAVARRAAAIITISRYSAHQISQTFNIAPGCLHPIHLAPSGLYGTVARSVAVEQAENRFDIRDYILAIASAAPRKNIVALLCAYARLPRSLQAKHRLVLVCTHRSASDELARLATSLEVEDRVTFLDGVIDEDLLILYTGASVFAFPSIEEGFGLPPLEAMACGTPVVASDISSMPEVLGDAAILVSPTDIEALSNGISRVLTDNTLATALRDKGLVRVRNFSWEKTAQETLSVYNSVAHRQ